MDDLDDLHAVFSNPAAMRYWDSLPHDEIDRTQWLVEGMVFGAADSDDFVVEHSGRAIGKAGCWRLGEIGVILHPDHWGKGFAFEALSAVIPHVFQARSVDRLTAEVDPRNAASLGLLRRLGFRETGRASRTIQVGGVWCDSVYLELPRPG